MKEKRIWHNHDKWEDLKAGLYAPNKKENRNHIKKSCELLANPEKITVMMRQVINDWPFSTEHNLTNKSSNRKAWLGQAACCLHHGANDDSTKKAWNELSHKERNKANQIAKEIIETWTEQRYGAGVQIAF